MHPGGDEDGERDPGQERRRGLGGARRARRFRPPRRHPGSSGVEIEHASDFEWRVEGEEAELALYAPDTPTAEAAFEEALLAARLPGTVSPAYAAASRGLLGWVAASETHAAPDLFGPPAWGLLVVADTPPENVAGALDEVPRLVARGLSEVALPSISEADARGLSELGAAWAAGEGLIEEDDLSLFPDPEPGDADALSRGALTAGVRDWARPGELRVFRVGDVLDAEGAGGLGLEGGALAFTILAGAEDLGRLALAAHRERILARTMSGDFGAPTDLPAAPLDTDEARDLLAAAAATANYAAGRAALVVYALRRALADAGDLYLRAVWKTGGLEERDARAVHRNGLAAVAEGATLASGNSVAAGSGVMLQSAPPFEAPEEDVGRWPWEEAGLLSRWATLQPL